MQDENYIDKAHGRGLRAHVWTVNEKHEMKALVKAEADAIITNYPDIAVEIVKNA
jgi:glycerophosphoryl diester phosphodiesterase